MKKTIICMSIFFLLTNITVAQSTRNKKTAKKPESKNLSARINAHKESDSSRITILNVTAEHAAKAGVHSLPVSQYTISDPTINTLNARALGSDIRISNSGIVGMPKRAYGFANGHLALSSTGATSSGTITGSGAVGTGSSLGNIGSRGAGIGMNGKSPYAGSAMWGNARGLMISNYDSTLVKSGNGKNR